MQTIQKMLQQLITPTAKVKTTVSTEPSWMTASTGGAPGPTGRYYIHHDKALVPIPSSGVLDLMRMNWPGRMINILGTLWAKKKMMFVDYYFSM
jgi:hypothetical protein